MCTELASARVASDPHVAHRLAVTWQHPYTRSIQPVGVLTCGTEGCTFAYLARADEVDGFQTFLGFADLHRRYTSQQLFPLFAQRVMRASRPDYSAYLRALALADDATAWAILARSQGERENDGIRVFAEPEVDAAGRSSVTFFVSGLRHRLADDPAVAAALGSLVPGAALQLRDEPDNAVNRRAVLVVEQTGTALAWVPDVLLDYTHAIAHPTVTVAAVNGSEVPVGFRLLVVLRGQVPTGYVAFDGPRWAPAASPLSTARRCTVSWCGTARYEPLHPAANLTSAAPHAAYRALRDGAVGRRLRQRNWQRSSTGHPSTELFHRRTLHRVGEVVKSVKSGSAATAAPAAAQP